MPLNRRRHRMVRIQKDVVVIGGEQYWNSEWSIPTSLYRMTCANKICAWTTMTQTLKIGRYYHVAIPIPDDLTNCT